MGTSASSLGPNNQSPLVPPWAEQGDSITIEPSSDTDGDINTAPEGVDGSDNNEQGNDSNEIDNAQVQSEIPGPAHIPVQPSRFASARHAFGKYAQSGGTTSHLRKSLKSYAKKSSGGGKGTSRRLASGITAGAGLLGIMRGDSVTVNNQKLSLGDLKGLTTDQAIDKIASHLAPDNADADAIRIALDYALEEALPDTNDFEPESFTDDVVQEALSCYLTDLIFQDVVTGMGRAWFHVEPASKHHKMEEELRELIKVIAQEQMEHVTNGNPSSITRDNITKIQIDAITMTVDEWENFDD
jgi:hypothetical protein